MVRISYEKTEESLTQRVSIRVSIMQISYEKHKIHRTYILPYISGYEADRQERKTLQNTKHRALP